MLLVLQSLLRRFSIRARMRGAILIVLASFGLIGLAAVMGGAHLKTLNATFMASTLTQGRTISELRGALGDVRRWEKDMVIGYENGVAVLKAREAWAMAIARTRQALEALHGDAQAGNPVSRKALERLDAYATASEPVLQQIQNGAFDNATAVDRMLDRAKEHIVAVEQSVLEISKLQDARAEDAQREFDQAMLHTLLAFGAVMALVMVAVLPLTLLNSASIIDPINAARRVAQSIAAGDLTQAIDARGNDEAADLQRTLSEMQTALRSLVGQVRHASDSISVASSEVATGNQDLSQRTEQTASNLQQAASSMEQLTGTVKQSADSARQANQLAGSAAEVAGRGGKVVAQVVATMDDINASSKKIADIIGVIDGIAFQTNILALNAAVEAARAGEQGRGFAVVASEVRSLAQRSAEAAKEIKGLIGASVDKVEGGAKLVADAGRTMTEIVASVQRVSDIIGEITAASAEQSQGIVEVSSSVNDLDQMTQQNAALVEQSAAAAESLREQAARLSVVVSGFTLDTPAAAVAKPPAVRPPAAPARAPVVPKPALPKRVAAAVPTLTNAVERKVEAATPASPAGGDWETF